jgi:hypothetical protein
MKKVIVQFDFPEGTRKQYDQVWNDIRASGNDHPKGLLFHTGAPNPNGGWFVLDLWESEQAFQEFGKVLVPFIQKNGFPMVTPTIMEPAYVYEAHHESQLS